MAKAPISRYMDLVGDGSGADNIAIQDGSVTPVIFKIKPGAGEILEVNRLIISMTITANNANSGYAGQAAPLTNGLQLKVITGAAGGSTVWDITNGVPIQSNHDWKNLMHDEILSTYGTTQSDLSYRYTFTKDGRPVELSGDQGDELQLIINDDMTAVTNLGEHRVRAGMCKLL